jgi:hypothetical protein
VLGCLQCIHYFILIRLKLKIYLFYLTSENGFRLPKRWKLTRAFLWEYSRLRCRRLRCRRLEWASHLAIQCCKRCCLRLMVASHLALDVHLLQIGEGHLNQVDPERNLCNGLRRYNSITLACSHRRC